MWSYYDGLNVSGGLVCGLTVMVSMYQVVLCVVLL